MLSEVLQWRLLFSIWSSTPSMTILKPGKNSKAPVALNMLNLQQKSLASRRVSHVNRLIGERVPASTKRTTDIWLKMFRTFCDQAKLTVNLREDPAEKIAEALALCYVNSRGQNGQPCQRPSLMGLRAALHRHISSMGRDINNLNGEEFRFANDALDARLKELKRTGEAKPAKHKAIITDTDLERLGNWRGLEPAELQVLVRLHLRTY